MLYCHSNDDRAAPSSPPPDVIQLVQRVIDLGKKSRIPFLDDDIVRIFREKFYLFFMDAAAERTLYDGIDLTFLEGDAHTSFMLL